MSLCVLCGQPRVLVFPFMQLFGVIAVFGTVVLRLALRAGILMEVVRVPTETKLILVSGRKIVQILREIILIRYGGDIEQTVEMVFQFEFVLELSVYVVETYRIFRRTIVETVLAGHVF